MSIWDTAGNDWKYANGGDINFDNIKNILSGGARNDIRGGYNDANSTLEPYRDAGNLSMQQLQDLVSQLHGQNNDLSQYGNPADWSYKEINQSPTDFYNKTMEGYTQSPDAKYALDQATRAEENAASASGLQGSGAFIKAAGDDANRISQGDRQQFFNNVNTANNQQQGYLSNFQNQDANQKNRISQILQYLTSLGYGGSTTASQNNAAKGNALAKSDQGSISDLSGIASMLAGLAG